MAATSRRFSTVLPSVCSRLAAKIAKEHSISEEAAIIKLYNSKLYEYLVDEDTQVWHYGIELLFDLFEQEQAKGEIEFPDV